MGSQGPRARASSSGCCRSSRRGCTLVNDVNFILYTPFLPEAAAGLLEPRHVVTPLREVLHRTYLRLGAVTEHDPAARTVSCVTHEGEAEEIRYDQIVFSWARSRGRCPSPASTGTPSASRASRTRSGCATT